ncbi:hypothetical protein DRJ12_03195 [Candidatus Acetothermia bacterium]|nr:MAG: hypothetical protein DRJ12_03195 [Candidatus Acetothermia bacterium]
MFSVPMAIFPQIAKTPNSRLYLLREISEMSVNRGHLWPRVADSDVRLIGIVMVITGASVNLLPMDSLGTDKPLLQFRQDNLLV